MIVCPNCGKDIADDSAHCGFCGFEIESGGGKKTMIGFAAVTGDVMKQAAEEAKRAREAASSGVGDQASEGKLKIPKPNIPTSVGDEPSSGGLPSPGKLSIPKIGGTRDSRPPEAITTDAVSSPDAKTEQLEPVSLAPEPEAPAEEPGFGGAPSTIEERAAAGPQDEFGEDEVATSPTEPPSRDAASWSGPAATTPAGADDPAWAGGGKVAESTMPEISTPSAEGSAGPVVISGNNLPEKSSNKMLIPLIAVIVLIGGCCIIALVGSFVI